jgi:hypothetical protein
VSGYNSDEEMASLLAFVNAVTTRDLEDFMQE